VLRRHLYRLQHDVLQAVARLYLGMIALDGDGDGSLSRQSDDEARFNLEAAHALASAGLQRMADHGLVDGWALRAGVKLVELQQEASDALRNLERFTYFANGRP